jgi:hypothetical protein
MAKYRHRIFEMYDFRDEAVRALTPPIEVTASDRNTPESQALQHLDVSHSARVTHVKFQGATTFGHETINDLRGDFAQLADGLDKDSKVLMDFTGVVSFSLASIDALAKFNERLRTKGSRMVLCSLAPTARDCFFAGG